MPAAIIWSAGTSCSSSSSRWRLSARRVSRHSYALALPRARGAVANELRELPHDAREIGFRVRQHARLAHIQVGGELPSVAVHAEEAPSTQRSLQVTRIQAHVGVGAV